MEFISRASRFCERVADYGIAQVSNSWSNLAFVVVSAYLFSTLKSSTSNFSKNWGLIYIILVFLIGATSFYNHATLSYWGGATDVASMFYLVSLLCVYGLSSTTKQNRTFSLVIWLIILIPLTYFALLTGPITDYVFATLVVALIAIELYRQNIAKIDINKKLFWQSLLIFIIAFILWQLDVRKIFCYPDSIFQLHALWHILTAVTTVRLYQYYSSER